MAHSSGRPERAGTRPATSGVQGRKRAMTRLDPMTESAAPSPGDRRIRVAESLCNGSPPRLPRFEREAILDSCRRQPRPAPGLAGKCRLARHGRPISGTSSPITTRCWRKAMTSNPRVTSFWTRPTAISRGNGARRAGFPKASRTLNAACRGFSRLARGSVRRNRGRLRLRARRRVHRRYGRLSDGSRLSSQVRTPMARASLHESPLRDRPSRRFPQRRRDRPRSRRADRVEAEGNFAETRRYAVAGCRWCCMPGRHAGAPDPRGQSCTAPQAGAARLETIHHACAGRGERPPAHAGRRYSVYTGRAPRRSWQGPSSSRARAGMGGIGLRSAQVLAAGHCRRRGTVSGSRAKASRRGQLSSGRKRSQIPPGSRNVPSPLSRRYARSGQDEDAHAISPLA